MIGFKKLCQETVINKKANIELPSIIKLEYYKTESKLPQNKKYGIEVRKQEIEGNKVTEEKVSEYELSNNEKLIDNLLRILVKNKVTPVTTSDIITDFKKEPELIFSICKSYSN